MLHVIAVTLPVSDVQTMTDVAGNPEEERRADFYYQPWAQEAVCRYFYGKVTQNLYIVYLTLSMDAAGLQHCGHIPYFDFQLLKRP